MELLALAVDEVLTDASVEFSQLPDGSRVTIRGRDTVVRHVRARLLAVALVPEGAYGEHAQVLSVRDTDSDKAVEEARAWLEDFRRRA
jgi:hypothetical protein